MSLSSAPASVNPSFVPAWSTTATPDWLFDEVAPDLDKAPLKVLLYIVRRTSGFRKSADAISLNQFQHGIMTKDGRQLDKGCGVTNRTTLLHALDDLEARGLIAHQGAIHADGGNATTIYYLRGPRMGGGAVSAPPQGAATAPTTNRRTNKQEDRKIVTPYPRYTDRGTTHWRRSWPARRRSCPRRRWRTGRARPDTAPLRRRLSGARRPDHRAGRAPGGRYAAVGQRQPQLRPDDPRRARPVGVSGPARRGRTVDAPKPVPHREAHGLPIPRRRKPHTAGRAAAAALDGQAPQLRRVATATVPRTQGTGRRVGPGPRRDRAGGDAGELRAVVPTNAADRRRRRRAHRRRP